MNSSTAPTILVQTLSNRLIRYDNQLKGFWAMIRQQHDQRRQPWWLPLVSLGLGVVNFAHLAILHGKVDTLASAVSKITHRVDLLTNFMSRNAGLIQKLIVSDTEFLSLATTLARENIETRWTVNALMVAQTANQDIMEIIVALLAMTKHQLPMHLINLKRLTEEFEKFILKVKKENLTPIDSSPAQLLANRLVLRHLVRTQQ